MSDDNQLIGRFVKTKYTFTFKDKETGVFISLEEGTILYVESLNPLNGPLVNIFTVVTLELRVLYFILWRPNKELKDLVEDVI